MVGLLEVVVSHQIRQALLLRTLLMLTGDGLTVDGLTGNALTRYALTGYVLARIAGHELTGVLWVWATLGVEITMQCLYLRSALLSLKGLGVLVRLFEHHVLLSMRLLLFVL